MKLDNAFFDAETEVIGSGPAKTGKIQISEKNTKYFISLLTKVYSDPIGSIVREITSNCFDAHRKVGKVAPVVIRHYIDADTDQEFIDFVDQGTGLSPITMDEIYMSLGESDKRESDDYLGAFGLGSKSPFSYVTNLGYFYVITKVNNLQYTYLLNETQAGITYDLLSTIPTESENGTTIRIPFEKPSDKELFRVALIQQLQYFDDVFVFGFDKPADRWGQGGEVFNNDYTIVEHSTFKYRADLLEKDHNRRLHVAYGPVNYPIDFNVLGIRPVNLNVALKFELGELDVILNREQLKYTDKTIAALKEKFAAFVEEMRELWLCPANLEFTDIYEYLQHATELSNGKFHFRSNPLPVKTIYIDTVGLFAKDDYKGALKIANVDLTRYTSSIRSALRLAYKPVIWAPGRGILTSHQVGKAIDRFSNRTSVITGENSRRDKFALISKDTILKHERAYLNDKNFILVSKFNSRRALKSFLEEFLPAGYKHIDLLHLRSFVRELERSLVKVVETTHTPIGELNIPENYGKKAKEAVVRTDGTILGYDIHQYPSRVEITTVATTYGSGHYVIYATKEETSQLRRLSEKLQKFSFYPRRKMHFVVTSKKYFSALSQDTNAFALEKIEEMGLQAPWFVGTSAEVEFQQVLNSYKVRQAIVKSGVDEDKLSSMTDLLNSAISDLMGLKTTSPHVKLFFGICQKLHKASHALCQFFGYERVNQSLDTWKSILGAKKVEAALLLHQPDASNIEAIDSCPVIFEFTKEFFMEISWIDCTWSFERKAMDLELPLDTILEQALIKKANELNKFKKSLK